MTTARLPKSAMERKKIIAIEQKKCAFKNKKEKRLRNQLLLIIGENWVETYRENPRTPVREVLKRLSPKERAALWDSDDRLEKWGEETMKTIADAENGIGISKPFNSLAEMKASLNA